MIECRAGSPHPAVAIQTSMSDSNSPSPHLPRDGGVGRPRPTFSNLPKRDHLHRLANVFADNPLYFITCCAANRRRVLADDQAAGVVTDAFRSAPTFHGWSVGRYVVMPDHVHFFARPHSNAKSLPAFLRDWKKWTGRKIAESPSFAPPIWQPEFFDHVLRSAESYSEKWEYVRQNPVRAGLVTTAEAWPYTGEVEQLSF